MRFAEYLTDLRRKRILSSVLIELTYLCNLKCFFCYNDRQHQGRPLSLEQYQTLLEDLREMQVMSLSLSGGEPTLHRDFFAIGATARELGFIVRVKTNGHSLDETKARRIKDELDPFQLDISLHGAESTTHDRQTGVPGSFVRLCENVATLRRLGVRVKLNGTLTAWNEHEIAAMFDLADGLGVRLSVSPTVTPRDNNDQDPLQIAPSRQGIANFYRLTDVRAAAAGKVAVKADPLAQPTVRGKRPEVIDRACNAGSSTLAVDPWGQVFPCVQWRIPLGSLHERSIREIWHGSDQLEMIRGKVVDAREKMEAIYGIEVANFCPALAETLTGSHDTPYHSFEREMAARAEETGEE